MINISQKREFHERQQTTAVMTVSETSQEVYQSRATSSFILFFYGLFSELINGLRFMDNECFCLIPQYLIR